MVANCTHCWHNSTDHEGATSPVCCWCETRIVLSLSISNSDTVAHGGHRPVARASNGAVSALATLERARVALQEGRADAADDHVREVMDQIAGWCSPPMRVTL